MKWPLNATNALSNLKKMEFGNVSSMKWLMAWLFKCNPCTATPQNTQKQEMFFLKKFDIDFLSSKFHKASFNY